MQRIGKHVLMTMGWILLLLYLLGGALRPTDNPTPAVAQSVPAPMHKFGYRCAGRFPAFIIRNWGATSPDCAAAAGIRTAQHYGRR